ncbi:MAG TPA: hypothetical protein VK211_13575 [Kamptonema sp.]|nr:hypothetical protein [Kamptonema sp.]
MLTPHFLTLLLKATCNFQGLSLAYRENYRDKYLLKESNAEFTLRLLVDGQISLLAKKTRYEIDVKNPETSYQIPKG